MKRLSIIFLFIALAATMAPAQNWCEILISNLNTKSEVDKTVAVNRAPDTHEITNATYDFRFTSQKLYRQIYNTLKGHTAESDYYSESGGKYSTLTLRFSDKGQIWSCRLRADSRSKQFLVTVKSGDAASEAIMTSEDIESVRRQAEEARIQAQQQVLQAQKQALEAQRKAQKQAKEAQLQAQKQALEAQLKAQKQALEAQRKAHAQGKNAQSKTNIINAETPESKAELDRHNRELQNAEAERKKKLGL